MKCVLLRGGASIFLVALATATCAGSNKTDGVPITSPSPAPIAAERSAPMATPVAPPVNAAATAGPSASVPMPALTPNEPPAPPPPPAAAAPATPTTATGSSTAAPGSGYSGPDPCTLATKGDSPVARACRESGIRGAKVTMKELIKNARGQGVKFQCDDCHSNDTDYAQLAKGAEDRFAKLLAAANRK